MNRFNDAVGALLAVAALAIVGYLAIVATSEQAEGAIIALLSAAVGWLYRGRIQQPGDGQITVTADQPASAQVSTTARTVLEPLTPPAGASVR